MECNCESKTINEYIRATKNHDTGLTTLQKWVGCNKCGLPFGGVEKKVFETQAQELRQRPAPIKKVEVDPKSKVRKPVSGQPVGGVSAEDYNAVLKELRKKK